MKNAALNYQIALTLLKGIGPVRAKNLLAKLDSIEDFFHLSLSALAKQTQLKLSFLKQLNRDSVLEKATLISEEIVKSKVKSHFFTSDSYPNRLRECVDAPLLLFEEGDSNLNNTRIVSIVGTRHCTDYGKNVCDELIFGLKDKNCLVVSGLAYGIDIYIHQLCLQHNIPTVAVLGHGLDRIYPSAHRSIALQMQKNGSLLTEFLPGTKPDRENFPMRNRIVAGLADATIVIESRESGGSLITAELANDYNRDVFAYPGNVNQMSSTGCNLLISKHKAHLLSDSNAFLNWMHWMDDLAPKPIQRKLFVTYSQEEEKLLLLLENAGEQSIDSLSLKAKMTVSELSAHLFNLELLGAVKTLPGRKYVLIGK